MWIGALTIRRGLALGCLLLTPVGAVQEDEAEQARSRVEQWLEHTGGTLAPAWSEADLPALIGALGRERGAATPRALRLVAALEELFPRARSWMRQNITRESPEPLLLGALRVYAVVGGGREGQLAVDLASWTDVRRSGPELRRAVAEILRRDEPARRDCWSYYDHATPALRPFVIHAVGDTPFAEALEELVIRLAFLDAPHASILATVARVACAFPPPFDERLTESVREWLHSEDPAVRSAACQAVGALEDEESISVNPAVLIWSECIRKSSKEGESFTRGSGPIMRRWKGRGSRK